MFLLEIFMTFFKIGLFGFGGGYAMISLIQQELANHGWLDMGQFIDIIAIAEMTPGPIAINSGTFVGFKLSSVTGSFVATLGVIAPSFLLILLLARVFNKIKDTDLFKKVLAMLRPAVIGLIFAAALVLAKSSVTDWTGLLIAAGVVIILFKTRIHPILLIVLAGFSGIIFYG